MYNHISILLVVVATIINSIVFGYVASNSKNNQTNYAYLIYLTFTVFYIICDCIVIQAFSSLESKDIIVKIQAICWMPLSILFLNFVYLFIKKQKDEKFYLFTTGIIVSLFITLFSDKVLLGYKSFNLGTSGITGPWFLPITFIGILPPAVYALYLIGREGKVFHFDKQHIKKEDEPLLSLQLKILFFGSITCLIIAVFTNVLLEGVLGYSGKPHLASLSLSLQSLFLLPALIKYNFLNKPMDRLGDELYANSPDAAIITNQRGIIFNLNKSARKLFNLKGKINKVNIIDLISSEYNFFQKSENFETQTITKRHIVITKSDIIKGNQPLGKLFIIRDISPRKEAEEKLLSSETAYKHVIEASQDIIYSTNLKGIVSYVNPVFEKKSGYQQQELLGIDINTLVAPEYQQEIKDIYLNFINCSEANLTTESPCVKKNGKIIWLELSTSKLKSGNIINGFSTIARDITERKKTEHELMESEERYRLLVENSTEMIYKTDMMGNYTYVNQVFIKNLGISEEKILKMNCFDRIVKEHINKVKEFYRSQLINKKIISYCEFPCYIKKNTVIWVGQLSRLELNELGRAVAYSITARDVTDRKKTETELTHITKELITAQDVAGLGSFTYDITNNNVIWSDKLYEIYGKDKKTYNPSKDGFFNDIVHPDSRGIAIKTVDEAIKNKLSNFDYIHKALILGGKEKWFQAIIKIVYNKNKKAVLMNGTSQDITELYTTRLNLEKSELRLKLAQEIARLGTWEENHHTKEVYWSVILKKMFGVNKDAKINQGEIWNRVHPEDAVWMKKRWAQAEKEKTPYSGTFRIIRKDGKIKHLNEHAEFILDPKGNLHKTIGTVIDLTELHKYQEELRQLSSHIQELQEQERARIAREIHDELGQRLTSINMDLAFLGGKIENNTSIEVKERLLALNEMVEETIKITRELSQELRPSILDDLGLIAAIDWLKEQYNRRTNIHFTLDMPKEEIQINSEHATAVFRITQEALTNIIRHAKAHNVNIEIKNDESEISLNVRDDGRGIINKNKVDNIKTYGIFGMKERASSLGGRLIIQNNEGKGTTVSLRLPYREEQNTTT